MVYLLSLLWKKDFFPHPLVSSHSKQSMQILFCFVWSYTSTEHKFCCCCFLSRTPGWKLSRFEAWNLRKEKEASRGKQKITDNTKQKLQFSRAKFASQDKALLTGPQCPAPSPSSQDPRGKLQNENEAVLFLKAIHTHRTQVKDSLVGGSLLGSCVEPWLQRAIHLRVSSIYVIRTRKDTTYKQ